ncbi:MAG TPA: substrate-binding domain-containing protein [Sunxiuqinia sp.]|nr:substrate-binding domain-containing protein [Sunxiuqinia sp.]
MKQKIKLLVPFLFLLLNIFTACKTGPVKVGLLMHSLSGGRWERDKELITKDLEAQGAEVEFRLCNKDQALQNKQAQELVNDGVDVLIVVSADQNKSAQIVKMAHEKDVKVIAYDRLIKNCDLDFYVSTNSLRVGEEQARYMTSIYPNGNYALIIGNKHDNNALLLFIGQMNVLQNKVESGDIHIVYSEYTNDWSSEEGYRAAKDVLQQTNNQVDVIIAGADQLAYGIQRALKEAGLLGKVGIVSQDADLKILQSIVKGNQTATIYKPLEKMAQKAADLAVKLAKNEKIDKDYTTESNGKRLVPSYEMDPVLVNKDNMSSTVIASGFHTSQEIYQ